MPLTPHTRMHTRNQVFLDQKLSQEELGVTLVSPVIANWATDSAELEYPLQMTIVTVTTTSYRRAQLQLLV